MLVQTTLRIADNRPNISFSLNPWPESASILAMRASSRWGLELAGRDEVLIDNSVLEKVTDRTNFRMFHVYLIRLPNPF